MIKVARQISPIIVFCVDLRSAYLFGDYVKMCELKSVIYFPSFSFVLFIPNAVFFSNIFVMHVRNYNYRLNESQLWAAAVPKRSEISATFANSVSSDNISTKLGTDRSHPCQKTYAVYGVQSTYQFSLIVNTSAVHVPIVLKVCRLVRPDIPQTWGFQKILPVKSTIADSGSKCDCWLFVNEYQLRLERKRQVWFIPLADVLRVCR